jgi:LysM repeat protein
MLHIKKALFFYFLFLVIPAIAQDDVRQEIINGKKYYIHKVEAGHTLYAITKKYLIEIDEILAENPEAKDGLKIGQEIKILVVKENRRLHKVNNPDIEGNFVLHNVEQGQTLYSISKQYSIDIDEIVLENPGVQNSMPAGMTLRIPVDKVKNAPKEATKPAVDEGWLKHVIQKGETMYFLAKKYDVSIDSIPLVNFGLPDGLRVGDTINIPIRIAKESEANVYNYIKEKLSGGSSSDTIKIALLMPFFIEENQRLADNRKQFEKESLFPQSLIAIEFYEGFRMAVDSLVAAGMSAKIYVFDTGKDTAQLKLILSKPEMREVDIIFGPLYLSGFSMVSSFARKNEMFIVSPFIQQNSIIHSNKFVGKANPATQIQMEELVNFIVNKYSGANIALIHNNNAADKVMTNTVSNKMSEKKNGNSFHQVDFLTHGFSAVTRLLAKGKPNILIVPSNDQAFVTELINKLYFLKSEEQILLFGPESWMNFENIDIDYLHKLNTHLVTTNFIDYSKEEVKDFIFKYRKNFSTDPGVYAFQGYDVGMFYLSQIKKYGTNFHQKFQTFSHQGLQVKFNLNRLDENSGFENRGVQILKFQDYKLNKVD